MYIYIYKYKCMHIDKWICTLSARVPRYNYGVATIGRVLKIIGLFCRI